MSSKFFYGAPILIGNNTTPGVQMPEELKEHALTILKACKDWGLDFYPTVINLLTYDEISEIAAYGGFPVRYNHWSFGGEYEELQRGYELNMHKIYELVINSSPCQIYCLASNTLLDHLTVIAHATGHNDFFKNNIHFSATDTNMLNNMANHGVRVKKYMARWGNEKVTEFLDYLLRIDTLVDGAKAWVQKVIKDPTIRDSRKYFYPKRLKVDSDRLYMEPYINTKEFKKQENTKAKERTIAEELDFLLEPVKDILGFLRENAPLKPWQQDIMSMIYEESLYFHPQRLTKTTNEGFASMVDSVIMAEQGYASLGQKSHDCGIIEYSKHKMGVLGGKYSMNPYKLGYSILCDVRERWDKGQFGDEWEECRNYKQKQEWDLKLGLGKEKIFEVRKYYDDLTLIHEYFTEDLCRKMEYFEWGKYANGETRIESHDYQKIKKLLMRRHVNGGLPDIRLTESNYRGRGQLLLQHYSDGREIYDPYVREVLCALVYFWKNDVYLATKNEDGEEFIYECRSKSSLPTAESVKLITRKEHERQW